MIKKVKKMKMGKSHKECTVCFCGFDKGCII